MKKQIAQIKVQKLDKYVTLYWNSKTKIHGENFQIKRVENIHTGEKTALCQV